MPRKEFIPPLRMCSSLDIFHAPINYNLSVTIFSSFSNRFVFRDILSEEEHPLVVFYVEISSAWLPDKEGYRTIM